MSKRTDFILTALKVISWIIFIGLCIQTGTLLFNYIYSLFKPVNVQNLHLGLNLSAIYAQSKTIYNFLFSFAIILSALKAFVFYLVIKIFQELNMVKPFSKEICELISKISYYAFSAGITGIIAESYPRWLMHKGYEVDELGRYWNDSQAYLLMAAIVFVIAIIFKKGIELQSENDLTI